MSNDGNTQRSLALALLAIPASAIVTVAQGSGQFGPWEIPVGLLIVFVTLAYEDAIEQKFLGTAAFSIMLAAGILFCSGWIIDGWFGDISGAPVRANNRNWTFVSLWLVIAAIAGWQRTRIRAIIRTLNL